MAGIKNKIQQQQGIDFPKHSKNDTIFDREVNLKAAISHSSVYCVFCGKQLFWETDNSDSSKSDKSVREFEAKAHIKCITEHFNLK